MRGNDAMLAGELQRALVTGQTFQYYADLEKKIQALQPGDVNRTFQKFVKPKDLVIIQAGDLEKK
jgi:zinc protease